MLLWLWHRPSATALIRSLAWEPPYAEGVALEKDKKDKIYIYVYIYIYTYPGSMETNLNSIYEDADSIPSLTQWFKDSVLP